MHRTENWEYLIQLATDCWGNPRKFWKSTRTLLGGSRPSPSYLVEAMAGASDGDSEDSDFGEDLNTTHIDPSDKANFMSRTWENIYKPNAGAQFDNPNTRRVGEWFRNIEDTLQHDVIINLNNLVPDDPLLRPVSSVELRYSLTQSNNKAPGFSGIRIVPFQNLPPNYFNFINLLFNAIIASKYWPLLFKK